MKGPTDGGHTGTQKRSARRSTQTDAPGPAAATPTWNNTGPRWTGGGLDTTPETATDEPGGPLGEWGGAQQQHTSKASLESSCQAEAQGVERPELARARAQPQHYYKHHEHTQLSGGEHTLKVTA